jgi:hypothetical protein
LGYGEASAIGSPATYLGESIDNTTVLARWTRYGDANLDGLVNLQDFNRLAANFGTSNAVWTQGDFDFNGLVNLGDFNRLAANFGLVAGPDGPTAQDWANLMAAVPEPSSLGALLMLGIGARPFGRRRRRAPDPRE